MTLTNFQRLVLDTAKTIFEQLAEDPNASIDQSGTAAENATACADFIATFEPAPAKQSKVTGE